MLTKSMIESELQTRTGVSHVADILTPISARVRPVGIANGVPGYSVIIERRSYRMRAKVAIDSYGAMLRNSIISAIENDPDSLKRIDSDLKDADWSLEYDISEDSFVLGAVDSKEFRDPKSSEEGSAYAASVLSGFVLQRFSPVGVFEIDQYAIGTLSIAKSIAESSAISIIGGGDSSAAVKKAGVSERITHISTGGGASLEYIQGNNLPGIELIQNCEVPVNG